MNGQNNSCRSGGHQTCYSNNLSTPACPKAVLQVTTLFPNRTKKRWCGLMPRSGGTAQYWQKPILWHLNCLDLRPLPRVFWTFFGAIPRRHRIENLLPGKIARCRWICLTWDGRDRFPAIGKNYGPKITVQKIGGQNILPPSITFKLSNQLNYQTS
jgi:hypothetical protein